MLYNRIERGRSLRIVITLTDCVETKWNGDLEAENYKLGQGSELSPNLFRIFAKFIVNSPNFIKDFPQRLFKFPIIFPNFVNDSPNFENRVLSLELGVQTRQVLISDFKKYYISNPVKIR